MAPYGAACMLLLYNLKFKLQNCCHKEQNKFASIRKSVDWLAIIRAFPYGKGGLEEGRRSDPNDVSNCSSLYDNILIEVFVWNNGG